MKRSLAIATEAFEEAGYQPSTNGRYPCPAHNGQDGNLSIHEDSTGQHPGEAFVTCHSQGCKSEDIWRAVGLQRERKPAPKGRHRFEARADGIVVGYHVREDDGQGGKTILWDNLSAKVNDLDLYRSWDLNGHSKVVIAEGERATDALWAASIPAVGTYGTGYTPSARALAALDAYDLTLWPDNDDKGKRSMDRIAQRLGKPVKVVDLDPTLPAKWDAADASPVDLRYHVEGAIPFTAASKSTGVKLSMSLADVPTDPPPPMLLDLLDPQGATVLFGDGGVGKGSLAAWLVKRMVDADMRVGIFDFEHQPREWSRRTYAFGLDDPAHIAQVRLSLPNHRDFWDGSEGALWDIVEDVRSVVDEHDLDYLVFDSVGRACNHLDPSTHEAATKYIDAVGSIGKPSLNIAHVTKTLDATKPFGSTQWHNGPRMTISYELKGGDRILTHRKANNYSLKDLPRWLVSADFDALGMPLLLNLSRYDETIWDRVSDLLTFNKGKRYTPEAIADELAKDVPDGQQPTSAATVKSTLNRNRARPGINTERVSARKTEWWAD